jgi:hypothetical protein
MSDVLRARIAKARGLLRRAHLLVGLARCLVALLGLTAAFFVLDWLVVSRLSDGGANDLVARGVLLVGVLGALAWVVMRTVVAEARTRRSEDLIALRVERGYPQLHGRLISTVQLSRRASGDDSLVSRELIDVLGQETTSVAAGFDFGSIVDWRTLVRAMALASALLALALALSWWRRDYASALLARMALAHTGYPTAASIIDATRGGLAAYGEPFSIQVELDPHRQLPDQASATIRTHSGEVITLALPRVVDAPTGRAIYRGELPRVLEDVDFRPTALDARWPSWEHVRVAQRPAVKELAVACDYPAYLGLPAESVSSGDLRIPVGTTVHLRASFTGPVASATVTRRLGADAAHTQEQSAEMTLDATRGVGESSFTVDASGSYLITLRDANGLGNADPIVYSVAALPDLAPTVSILSPAKDKLVTRFAQRTIRFTVSDDHGISKAWLKYVVGMTDADAASDTPKSVELTGLVQQGESHLTREVVMDLAKYGVVEGSRLTYWIEVADNRQPEPNIGTSRHFVFTVVDMATMADLLEQEKTKLVGELESLHDRQRDTHNAVETVRQAATATDDPSGDSHERHAP